MHPHVYALRSWTIRKSGEQFFIAVSAQSGTHRWRGPYANLRTSPRMTLLSCARARNFRMFGMSWSLRSRPSSFRLGFWMNCKVLRCS